MEFRANFFAKILGNTMWIVFFILVLLVVYSNTDSIAGWNRGDSLVLAATVFLMNALHSALFFSVQEIPMHVRMGTLDYIVTKPIDTQFWVSTRRFNFDQIGTMFAGMVMVVVGVAQTHVVPSPLQWLTYVVSVATSLVIFYSFNVSLMTTGVWLVRVENLWVLTESLSTVARFPTDIFPAMLQRVFTFYVPLALIATVPSRQLVIGLNLPMAGLSVLWAAIALFLSRTFWRYAMTQYTSASS